MSRIQTAAPPARHSVAKGNRSTPKQTYCFVYRKMVQVDRVSIRCSPSIGVSKIATSEERDGSLHVALVCGSSIWTVELNRNEVTSENELQMKHFTDCESSEAYTVGWCAADDRKYLVVACNSQIYFFLRHHDDNNAWKVTFMHRIETPNVVVVVNSLAFQGNFVYVATTGGLMELDVKLPDVQSHQLPETKSIVLCATSSSEWLATADDSGGVSIYRGAPCRWKKSGEPPKLPGGSCCTALLITATNLLVSGFNTGHIRLLKMDTGAVVVEIAAHCRWISTLLATAKSGFVSAAEDGFIHLWKLDTDDSVIHEQSTRLEESLVVGGASCGNSTLLAVYDVPGLFCLKF